MTTLKQAEDKMEVDATLREAYLFEAANKKVMLIAVTEQSRLGQIEEKPDFEYYRARATKPGTFNNQFDRFGNCVSVTVCHHTHTVMFGPTSQIQMYPEGHGLGPALMARVIDWLHRKGLQNYVIQPGMLSSHTVNGDSERLRRNQFYMKFGFVLSGSDKNGQSAQGLDVLSGHFSAPTVGVLKVQKPYLDRLVPCSDFYSKLSTERYVAQQNVWDIQSHVAWAKGSSWAALLKRIVLFIMNSPIDKR
ncbi:hypothetical protein FGA82_19470 [Pseudomonas fluorescens]|uniref:hypothetical protein n=1 Tax=Pseudomonas fluorescens TaxID=294 RepID=UPI001132235D|nr:hypothetical protein [Pseudomonas fluorescens]TMU76889.1 hypothetical protein FGA82_19470 [Pseudomonas fluorescens]